MSETKRKQRPALDPEAREKQLMNLAYDLAEKQLAEGTASPSVINHFLKLATKREALEQTILEKNAVFLEAKAQSIHTAKEAESMAKNAIEAMKSYRASND